MRLLGHIGRILAGLLITLILPGLFYTSRAGLLTGEKTDAVSGATMVLPDKPSGKYIVLLNKERHTDTVDDWRAFFEESTVGVIMEDISCLAISGDTGGEQLAGRYKERLAQNQMKLKSEDAVLVASRVENGIYDIVVVSEEMAEAVDLPKSVKGDDAEIIRVGDGAGE